MPLDVDALSFIAESLSSIRQELKGEAALLGFVGEQFPPRSPVRLIRRWCKMCERITLDHCHVSDRRQKLIVLQDDQNDDRPRSSHTRSLAFILGPANRAICDLSSKIRS